MEICWECTVGETGYVYYSNQYNWMHRCKPRFDLAPCVAPPLTGPPTPKPPPEPEKYKIYVPGFQDFIRVPALEDSAIRRERFFRYFNSQTVLPEKLRWIPTVIGWLDDAQDLLITGLLLARPLLKKMPARFIPYLGWVLLANDVLNLSTGFLGTAMGGRSFKRATLDAVSHVVSKRGFKITQAEHFLKNGIPWMSAVLQGGQALETVTGYGLALGGMMGFLTGSFWGSIRLLTGNDVSITGFPKNDLLGKACRVLSQTWTLPNLRNVISQEDRDILLGSIALAVQIVAETHQPASLVLDYRTIKSDRVPTPDDRFRGEFVVWMEQQNIRTNGETIGGGYPTPTPGDRPTLEAAHVGMAEAMDLWTLDQRERDGMTTKATMMQLIYNETGRTALNWAAGSRLLDKPIFYDIEMDAGHAIEYGIRLPSGTPVETQEKWMHRARVLAQGRGKKVADWDGLREAAREIAGGYERIPFQTFIPQQ